MLTAIRFLLLLSGALATACGHATSVRPAPKDTVQAELAVGGPMVHLNGGLLPVPLSTMGARYGLGERYDVAAHVHLTTLSFGVVGLDVGSTYLLLHQEGGIPALSASGRLYGFGTAEDAPRAYLELTGSASYLLGERYLTYLSGTSLVQFAGGPPLWSLAAGEEVRLGRFGLLGEFRWYGPGIDTRFTAVDWASLAGQGAWGLVLGLSYRLGGST